MTMDTKSPTLSRWKRSLSESSGLLLGGIATVSILMMMVSWYISPPWNTIPNILLSLIQMAVFMTLGSAIYLGLLTNLRTPSLISFLTLVLLVTYNQVL